MDRIHPIGPRTDVEPVRPAVLPPREREQRKREREERRRRRAAAVPRPDEPPRLDVRA